MTSSTIFKAFDGHTIHPHGIISTFLIDLRGKSISIEVEVVMYLLITTCSYGTLGSMKL